MNAPALIPAGVVPQFRKPVDPWGSYSCWAASGARQVRVASGGRIQPTWLDIRKRAGRWLANPTHQQLEDLGPGNVEDEKKALESYAPEFKALGLQAPRMRLLGVTNPNLVRQYLAAGGSVSVAIGYSVVNRRRPKQSGSPTFQKGHAWTLQGLFDKSGNPVTPEAIASTKGTLFTDVEDSLDDGRLVGGKPVAKGPQRMPLWVVFEACAAVPIAQNGGKPLGAGKVIAAVVFPSQPIPVVATPPVVTPPVVVVVGAGGSGGVTTTPAPDPCADAIATAIVNAEQERDDAFTARDALLAEVARLQGVNRQIVAIAMDASTPLTELIALASDPANTGGDDS